LHGIDGVGLVALIDSRRERTQSLARGFPAAVSFSSLSEAMAEIDAVVIATHPTSHLPLAMQAIAAGKHVLVEKPLATTAADADRLISAAADAGVVLMVGHTFEYNPAVRKLRDIVHSGDLGRLYYLDSARLNLGLYQSDVNVIFDLAPHDVSIINYVLGMTPTAVQAWASRHAHRRFEDVAYLRLYYDADVSAHVHVSWLDPCKVRRVTAVGSEKMAVYNDLAADEPVRIHDKGVVAPTDSGDLTQPPMSYRYGDIISPYIRAAEPLAQQDEHFIECIQDGSTPHTNGVNGLAVVAVLEAAQLSVETGLRVEIDEVREGLTWAARADLGVAGLGLITPRLSRNGSATDTHRLGAMSPT
jgi:predicted dehydrogenase